MMARRRLALLLLCAAVVALLLWWRMGPDTVRAPSAPKSQASAVSNNPASRGVYARNEPSPAPAAPAAKANVAAKPEPPPLPFTFAGRISEGGQPVIVLRRGGRVLKVRGPGPLDEQYAVDAIQQDLMLIRYLPMGVQQVLELSARQEALAGGAPAAETEQD